MAGYINSTPNLNLNQTASFDVVNPVDAGLAVAQQQNQANIARGQNFQSGINNAITQAAATYRNQVAQEQAMARQLEEQDFLRQKMMQEQSFAQQQALAAEDRAFKRQFQTAGNFMDFLTKTTDTAIKTGMPKEQLQEILSMGAEQFALNSQDPQVQQMAEGLLGNIQTSQIQEMPVQEQTQFQAADGSSLLPDEMGASAALTGGLSMTQGAPTLLDTINSQVETARLESVSKAEEAAAKARGEEAKVDNIKKVLEAPERIREIGTEMATNENEQFVFDDIADRVKLVTADGDAAKQYGKDKQAYLAPGGRAMVGEAIKVSKSLREKMARVIENGAEIRGFDTNLAQALTQRLAGGDNEGALAILNKQLEQGFISKRGKLSVQEADQLSRELFADYRKLLGPLTSVNRTLFQSVGTQTEGDIDRAIGYIIPIGASAETAFDNIDNSVGTFQGLMVQSDAYYGNINGAKRLFKDYKNQGYTFDDLGTSAREDY